MTTKIGTEITNYSTQSHKQIEASSSNTIHQSTTKIIEKLIVLNSANTCFPYNLGVQNQLLLSLEASSSAGSGDISGASSGS